jgi:Ser/Thr protein kinase RdoA (MazF antagonist)
MTDVAADVIADAFGFAPPIGEFALIRQRGAVAAWRVDTGAGAMLVKRFWHEDELPWREQLEQAMEFEQLAVRAGIDLVPPVVPPRPVFGSVARIEGRGLFRAFPYVEHRPLRDDDDVAEWVGTTLARMHQLRELSERPDPHWWYGQLPPAPPERWLSWLDHGEHTDTLWAPALRERLEFVLEQADRVVATFNTSPPYVVSHRDVEPWNVLMTADRPMLIDWDTSGPESVPLEIAYVFVNFAIRGRDEPDPQAIRRSHAAYVAAGGHPLVVRPGLLDRLIGRHLGSITLSLQGYFDGGHSDEQIRQRIEDLPAMVANVRAWERLLKAATT